MHAQLAPHCGDALDAGAARLAPDAYRDKLRDYTGRMRTQPIHLPPSPSRRPHCHLPLSPHAARPRQTHAAPSQTPRSAGKRQNHRKRKDHHHHKPESSDDDDDDSPDSDSPRDDDDDAGDSADGVS